MCAAGSVQEEVGEQVICCRICWRRPKMKPVRQPRCSALKQLVRAQGRQLTMSFHRQPIPRTLLAIADHGQMKERAPHVSDSMTTFTT